MTAKYSNINPWELIYQIYGRMRKTSNKMDPKCKRRNGNCNIDQIMDIQKVINHGIHKSEIHF